MIVELAINIVIGFVIVVVGSYIGAKMALNTFFGRRFDLSEIDRLPPTDSTSDDRDR